MDLYSIALFVHVVGAVLVFVLLTVEGAGLKLGFDYSRFNRAIGPVSAIAILVPGLYMMKEQWGWVAWIATGIVSYVLIAVVGAYTGVAMMRGRMDRNTATISWLFRTGMALGVVFIMSVKPELLVAVSAVAAGALIGLATGLVIKRRAASIDSGQPQPIGRA